MMNPVLSFPRFRACLLIATGLAAAAAGCTKTAPPAGAPAAPASASSAGLKRIILLTNGNSPFWDACRAGLQDADKELKLAEAGMQAVLEVNDGTPQGQLDKLRQFGSQPDVVAIGVSVIDANNVAIADQMRELKSRGVKIVAIDSDLKEDLHDARTAFIGTNNLVGGRELGVCARNLRPEGGEYVTFVGRTGAQNAIERVGGFGEGAGEKFKSLDNMGDDLDRTRARDNVRNAIRNHPGLNTLVGIWSYNAPAIVDVVKELNKRESTTIVVFDAEPLAIEQVGQGLIDAMVVQNPYQMGFQGVRMMKALVTDDQQTVDEMFPDLAAPGGDLFDTGLKVVVPDEGSPLNAEMFGKKTEFLKLSEFRDWLKKFNLKGS